MKGSARKIWSLRISTTVRGRIVLLLLVLLYIASCLLFALARRDVNNRSYEVFRVKAAHAELSGAPRLLLAGGSNVIWGFRSAVLEHRLHVPTTNLGIEREADSPSAYLKLVTNLVRRGDTVVYSSVGFYNLSSYDEGLGKALLVAAGLADRGNLLHRWKFWWSIYWEWAPRDFPLAYDLPSMVRRYLLDNRTELASRLNDYGDIKSCVKGEIRAQVFVPASPPSPYLSELRAFRDELRQRGAELVVDVSWLYVIPWEYDQWIASYQPQLERMRHEFVMMDEDLRDTVRGNSSLFCDTPNHLDDAAALVRTEKLARFLGEHWRHTASNKAAARLPL